MKTKQLSAMREVAMMVRTRMAALKSEMLWVMQVVVLDNVLVLEHATKENAKERQV